MNPIMNTPENTIIINFRKFVQFLFSCLLVLQKHVLQQVIRCSNYLRDFCVSMMPVLLSCLLALQKHVLQQVIRCFIFLRDFCVSMMLARITWLQKKVIQAVSIKFHLVITGTDLNAHQQFLKRLWVFFMEEQINQWDVVIAFIPITSRVGTDIEAALLKIPDSERTVLVVLHHTFDPNVVVPESHRLVTNKNWLVVDCLYHEDTGLLKCPRNSAALKETEKYLTEMKPWQAAFNSLLQKCIRSSPSLKQHG